MRLRWPMLVAMGSPVHEGIHIYNAYTHIYNKQYTYTYKLPYVCVPYCRSNNLTYHISIDSPTYSTKPLVKRTKQSPK